jgi:hypothetical protein
MTEALSCTAQFDLLPQPQCTLTVATSGNGSGTVTSVPGGIDCGADCVEDYDDGTYVMLTPSPATGSSFTGWSGDPDCLDRAVTMITNLSCTAEFTLQAPPQAPSDLAASLIQRRSVELTWTDNATGEDEYRVERKEEPDGSFFLLASYPADATRLVDTDVTAARTYTYRVLACFAGNCSSPSNEVTITVPALRIFSHD